MSPQLQPAIIRVKKLMAIIKKKTFKVKYSKNKKIPM